jgi:spore coat polysaccharide biosynthesis predicted glycosyltransferase SpsG
MAELMAAADVAISAGGTTSWELAFMGLPNIVITLADNQLAIAAALARAGISWEAGYPSSRGFGSRVRELLLLLLRDRTARELMSRRGRERVDGRGADRVVNFMMAGCADISDEAGVSRQ